MSLFYPGPAERATPGAELHQPPQACQDTVYTSFGTDAEHQAARDGYLNLKRLCAPGLSITVEVW